MPNPPSPPESDDYVSTAQVADALGVGVSTVKRWVDENVLSAHRTPGGHRKLRMAEVLRAVRDGNLPQADLTRLGLPAAVNRDDPASVHARLIEAIAAVDTVAIRVLVRSAFRFGLAADVIADRIIAPAMAHVGHSWEIGRIDVGDEHLITQAVVAAVHEAMPDRRTNTDPARPVAVGGAPENDHYILPSLLAKLTLEDAGWEAVNLGPHTPTSVLVTALNGMNPKLVWLSVAHVEDEEKFLADSAELIEATNRRGIPLVIGGQGLTDRLRAAMPGAVPGTGMAGLSLFARGIYARPRRPKRGRPRNDERRTGAA